MTEEAEKGVVCVRLSTVILNPAVDPNGCEAGHESKKRGDAMGKIWKLLVLRALEPKVIAHSSFFRASALLIIYKFGDLEQLSAASKQQHPFAMSLRTSAVRLAALRPSYRASASIKPDFQPHVGKITPENTFR